MDALADVERAAFRNAPEVAVVLDRAGVITAVNAAWSDSARRSGAGARCGVGTDYVRVCRVGMRQRAPGAARAFRDVSTVLAGRRSRAASIYPFATPAGLRWFRSEVFALDGGAARVGVRHLDLTELRGAVAARPGPAGTMSPGEPGEASAFHDGLDELLRGPTAGEHRVVLVAAVPEPDPDRQPTARALAQVVIERAADRWPDRSARVDLVLPLAPVDVGVVITASSLAEAMRAADRLRAATALLLPDRPAWGLAVAAGAADDAAALVTLAREAVSTTDLVRRPTDGTPRRPSDDLRAELHRCARRLTDAVAEFDHALDTGVPLVELVLRDQEVLHAENACLAAAARLHPLGR